MSDLFVWEGFLLELLSFAELKKIQKYTGMSPPAEELDTP